jgi:hypothetical protein
MIGRRELYGRNGTSPRPAELVFDIPAAQILTPPDWHYMVPALIVRKHSSAAGPTEALAFPLIRGRKRLRFAPGLTAVPRGGWLSLVTIALLGWISLPSGLVALCSSSQRCGESGNCATFAS